MPDLLDVCTCGHPPYAHPLGECTPGDGRCTEPGCVADHGAEAGVVRADAELPVAAALPPDFAPLPGAGLSSDVTRSAEADAAQASEDPACGHFHPHDPHDVGLRRCFGWRDPAVLDAMLREDDDEAPAADPVASRCRPIELDDGSVVRVQGMPDGEVSPELTAALTDVVDAVKRRHAAEHPPAVRPTDAGPDQCPRSDVHGPHRWRHKRVARQCPGLPVTQCRAEYPGSGQHGARIVACGRPRGHEGDHVEYIGDDAGPSWPATPPGRPDGKIGTTEWQRQNAAEVRAERAGRSVDEIRAAIEVLIDEAFPDDMGDGLEPFIVRAATAIVERYFGPLIADRDATIAELRTLGARAAETSALERGARRQLHDLAQEMLGHLAGLPDETTDRWRRVLDIARPKRLDERDPIAVELDRLREADARVRAWAQSWAASTDPGHTLQGAARQVLAALDGTDGGESDGR